MVKKKRIQFETFRQRAKNPNYIKYAQNEIVHRLKPGRYKIINKNTLEEEGPYSFLRNENGNHVFRNGSREKVVRSKYFKKNTNTIRKRSFEKRRSRRSSRKVRSL